VIFAEVCSQSPLKKSPPKKQTTTKTNIKHTNNTNNKYKLPYSIQQLVSSSFAFIKQQHDGRHDGNDDCQKKQKKKKRR